MEDRWRAPGRIRDDIQSTVLPSVIRFGVLTVCSQETMYEVSHGMILKAMIPPWLLNLDLTNSMRKARVSFEHLEVQGLSSLVSFYSTHWIHLPLRNTCWP